MGPADSELMKRWQQGDSLAFEALVRRWEQRVANLLQRLLVIADQIPDLCQEVFLKLYQARDRYQENGNFAPWLYQIVLNTARDAGRRRRRQPVRAEHVEPVDSAKPAEAHCEEKELGARVRQAVAELPAALTGTPASTLKSRFASALNRLRGRLQELGWNPEEMQP